MIREIESKEEVLKCIKLYMSLNDSFLLPVDAETAYKNLLRLVRKKRFIRVMEERKEIVAWIYCDLVIHLHFDFYAFQQIYFASNQSGLKAYKCVVKLHEAMEEEAIKMKLPMLISTGSHMDENNVFVKILEKQGWDRRGYMALKKL